MSSSEPRSRERYELPADQDIGTLQLLAFKGGKVLPPRLGLVGGLYADVVQGLRTLAGAERVLATHSTRETVPPPYGRELVRIAESLIREGRSDDALRLATLTRVAVEAIYGNGSELWISTVRAHLQAGAAAYNTVRARDVVGADGKVVDGLPGLASALETSARRHGDSQTLAHALSGIAQYLFVAGKADPGPPGTVLLLRARDALRETVGLSDRSLGGLSASTLAEVLIELHDRGVTRLDEAISAARIAVESIDRVAQPRTWLRARLILFVHAKERDTESLLSLPDIEAIGSRHGAPVAAACAADQARTFVRYRFPLVAWELLERTYELLEEDYRDSTDARHALLSAAAHGLDGGAVPCRNLDSQDVHRAKTRYVPKEKEADLAAALHLALHAPHALPFEWISTEGVRAVARMPDGFRRDATAFALARIHTEHANRCSQIDQALAFRCVVLGATLLLRIGLMEVASSLLEGGARILEAWRETVVALEDDEDIYAARVQLHGMLDACLREAADIDARLGEVGRDWLLAAGRALAFPARSGPTANTVFASVHSVAFKGAASTRLLLTPGTWEEEEGSRAALNAVAALEEHERVEPSTDRSASAFEDERRRCSWLYRGEARAGSTAHQRRVNLQSNYDNVLNRRMVVSRRARPIGFSDLVAERLMRPFGKRSAIVDIYLGPSASNAYTVHATVLSAEWSRAFGVTGPWDASTVVPDGHGTGDLHVDGLTPLAAIVRHRVREASGVRPVSRGAADELDEARRAIIPWFETAAAELRKRGVEHLVMCPHGPLAFLPLHLLPVGPRLLADDWCVTTIPTLGFLLRGEDPRPDSTAVRLGVVASPGGGTSFGLPAEPRLADQADSVRGAGMTGERLADGRATRQAALRLLRESTHVHIAAHGSSLDQIPSFHCLYLDAGNGEDGRLFAHQIMHSDFRGLDLVTLCACETALGRVDTAGNVRGLPLAFLAAGARTVIATLWPVATEAAADFFTSLYAHIGAGRGKLQAYRAAQLECRARHPRFADWGAFTYIGAWK